MHQVPPSLLFHLFVAQGCVLPLSSDSWDGKELVAVVEPRELIPLGHLSCTCTFGPSAHVFVLQPSFAPLSSERSAQCITQITQMCEVRKPAGKVCLSPIKRGSREKPTVVF